MAPVPPGLATALQDHYRLDRVLGQGGMATVYLAHDLRHDRDVALKVLRPELAAVLGRERFLAEIRLTAKLDHPHILTLIDSGESDGFLWYVVPFIRGESLRQKLERQKQLDIAEAIEVAGDIAGALDYAHAHGVIHRDVKPENILLHEGQAMLADFGIALAVREAAGERLTETGMSEGTPQYMTPEQPTAERQLDATSDVYSLGAVLYEMLAGEPPFTGKTGQAVIAKLMTERPTALRVLRDTVPGTVDHAVTRALAKVPADRFPTAAAFAAALHGGPPTETAPVFLHPPSRRVALPKPALALALLVVVGAVAWKLIAGGHRGRDPELVALNQRAGQSYSLRTAAGLIEAIREFNVVVGRDSTYTAAWAGLAKAYVRAYGRYFPVPGVPRDSVLRLAVWAASRARTADGNDAGAWLAEAMVSRMLDPTDVGPSIRSVRRSLALDSSVAEAWHLLAVNLADSGDFPGAMEEWRRAIRVNPSYAEGIAFLALGHYWRRQYDSAAVWADSAVAVAPAFVLGHTVVGYVAIERGDFARGAASFDAARRITGDGDIEAVHALAGSALAEARAGQRREAARLVQLAESLATVYTPVPLHTAVYVAEAHAGLGEIDQAISWLTRYEPRRDLHFQLHLRCDPSFAPLSAEPRFRALLILPRPPRGEGC